MDMFCYQCEQTAKGTGCTRMGVCGKDSETAKMQDLLVHACKGIAQWARRAREAGAEASDLARIDAAMVEFLFTTVTNVNFDAERIAGQIRRAVETRDRAESLCREAARSSNMSLDEPEGPATMTFAETDEDLLAQAEGISIARRQRELGEDATALQELATYGLKGMAAYADHARLLGYEDPEIYAFFEQALDRLAEEPTDVDELTGLALKVGEVNLRTMELLDEANTSTYGHPEPTAARVTPRAGKCICVSGHDLLDLAMLLEQTRDKGIDVYTHGEMLPCLAYPGLKRYPHLAGNYGGAWQDQQQEFADFPGPILMTTNCIQKPKDSYAGRIFTTGLVAWPGVQHIPRQADGSKDFSPVIEAALAAEGFPEDAPEKTIPIGFARNSVLSAADTVVEAVKSGAIRHFFLIGGCDGARPGRNYYTELAEQVPDDCVILTLACGKYRFNKMDFGHIGPLPRLLDCGQCNDAYSAIRIAGALAEAFDCSVNELPLSMILSWYEQKAVCILLSLLHLGIQDMRLGPTLPAFVTPAMLGVLQEKFNLQPVTTPAEDLEACLA